MFHRRYVGERMYQVIWCFVNKYLQIHCERAKKRGMLYLVCGKQFRFESLSWNQFLCYWLIDWRLMPVTMEYCFILYVVCFAEHGNRFAWAFKKSKWGESTVDNHNQISIRLQPNHSIEKPTALTVSIHLCQSRSGVFKFLKWFSSMYFISLFGAIGKKGEGTMTLM